MTTLSAQNFLKFTNRLKRKATQENNVFKPRKEDGKVMTLEPL